jgi:hypothetical protein
MMNEFPPKFISVMQEASHSECAPLNVTEYLEYLDTLGVSESDFEPIRPILQGRLFEHFKPGAGAERLERVIADLQRDDHTFHMEGGSWTNDISWVRGYEQLLGPMEHVSALFSSRVGDSGAATSEYRYRNALYHLLLTQTSCFRYWGSGLWTDYGRELCRRTEQILTHDF